MERLFPYISFINIKQSFLYYTLVSHTIFDELFDGIDPIQHKSDGLIDEYSLNIYCKKSRIVCKK